MPRTNHERVHGPFAHGRRWRVIFVSATGDRSVESYASLAEATAEIEAARAVSGSRTVGQAVTVYLESFGGSLRRSSEVTLRHRLVALLQLVTTDRQLATLDARTARKMVDARSADVAHETLRGELRVAGMFAAWCVKQGWLAFDPFAGIELRAPQAGRSIGKPQLRVDEARRFLAFVVADTSPEATAVLMALLMGMRAHEIVERTVRDLDDGGRLLWIPQSKTRAGIRQIAVPSVLQSRLAALAVGKAADTKMFGDMSRHALHYHVVRLAKAAGVPRVTPHGLRGSFATLAVTASLPGMSDATRAPTVAEVARTLGHADGGATMRRHYMAPGAEESAASARVGELLNIGEIKPAAEVIEPVGDSSWN